ncbi:MAG: LL-diaminopimelate aminotransferase [Muribaculaceae bacterium]|nr:LL-diaminopimelate aminotransferase [Muribaculaceae bacterium]
MIKVNDNFCKLPGSYLFSEVARKIAAFQSSHPDARVIRMGIGDVTRPICQAAVEALHRAADEQGSGETFHGYGPEQGYTFLTEKIAQIDYASRGIDIQPDEIFISDGAKSDTGNIGDILSTECRVAVTDPVYPVYVDTNVMAGRAGDCVDGRWNRLEYLPCTADNDFVPALPTGNPDVIYLCYPNNPTGTTLTRTELARWVDYALAHNALILFDAAYEAFVTEPDVPRSIYEIEGARRVAIEFRSFSKTAGFTGLRCGYTVIPRELMGVASDGREVSLRSLWLRRQTTKFNGASYPVQRAAEAIYSLAGQAQIRESVDYYLRNAALLRRGLTDAGLQVWGGVNSPYIWVKTPGGCGSWEFFDRMLRECHVVCTPGVGFGPSGEGYVRLTAFNTLQATEIAVDRFKKWKI